MVYQCPGADVTIPTRWGLNQQTVILTALEARSQKSGCAGATLPPKALGEGQFQASLPATGVASSPGILWLVDVTRACSWVPGPVIPGSRAGGCLRREMGHLASGGKKEKVGAQ